MTLAKKNYEYYFVCTWSDGQSAIISNLRHSCCVVQLPCQHCIGAGGVELTESEPERPSGNMPGEKRSFVISATLFMWNTLSCLFPTSYFTNNSKPTNNVNSHFLPSNSHKKFEFVRCIFKSC